MYLKLLKKHIKQGTLHLHLPDGKEYCFGERSPEAHWYVKDRQAMSRIARDWEFELGETYMRGLWDAGDSGLRALLAVLRTNFGVAQQQWTRSLAILLQEWNRITRSYRNVSHHYDVPEHVFRRFLDKEMFYSCAYYAEPNMSLEQAQQAKARHIASKLLVKPGHKVLDIGCGWGSMAFHLAEHHDCQVTGITLSREQLKVAREEARRRGLQARVQFELCDYRQHRSSYDRIVSIGMFEHVGRPYYDAFFRQVRSLLAEDGVALIHTIGRSGPPGTTNPWIRRYIFPGGSTPSPSQICAAVERSRLITADMEVWRLHYAQTLSHWYERFQAQRMAIRDSMGEEFCRMWEFYLAACESAFRYADLVVYQVQLCRQHGAVPLTRDYLYADPGRIS